MAFLFESETCSRCGGSGHYSYCQRYGTTCFKCKGKRETLTKRGQAAQNYFESLASLPLSELKPGMKIRETGVTFGGDVYLQWVKILEIKEDNTLYNGALRADYRQLECETRTGLLNIASSLDTKFRVAMTAQEKQVNAGLAIAYQRSLNKQGKPDKILAKLMLEVAYA